MVPAGLLVNFSIWQQHPNWPIQRERFDVWRHFLQPAGITPNFKHVDNTLLLIQMVAVIVASLWIHRRWIRRPALQKEDC